MSKPDSDNTASSVELVQLSLQKAEGAKELGAFIYLDNEGALEAAHRADKKRESGVPLGVLHGLPIVVKDNIHVAGMPNSAGTLSLKEFVPESNNAVVTALMNAGAIVIGKTNMHELAFGITSNNSAFGPVRNAHDPSRIAGGSSGGTAVAIAAGVVSMGLGSDTGGSTRIPAALNGIAGFRPSLGRYDTNGVTPLSSTRDTVGPMALSVKEIAILDAVVAGNDKVAQPTSLHGLRLGVPREYFYENLSPQVRNNIERVLNKLKTAGVQLIDVDLSGLSEINAAVGFPVVLYEFRRELAEYLKANNTAVSWSELVDTIASPDVKSIVEGQLGDQAMPELVYRQALDEFRPQLQALYATAFVDNKVEALIMPTTMLPAAPIVGSDETVELNGQRESTFNAYARNTDPSSNAGLPSLTLPSGKTDSGLPMGLMLDGPVDNDHRLIEIGLAIEALLDT